MANFKSPGINKRTLIICAALALCIPLLLVAKGDKGKGNKGGNSSMCLTVTADAIFRDAQSPDGTDGTDGIRSDGIWEGVYEGLNGSTVCLLTEYDYDFLLGTKNKKIEREEGGGIDRKVTLDFGANPQDDLNSLPFGSFQVVDVGIRVDLVLSDEPKGYTDQAKRFLMWFSVGRDRYQLRFDGQVFDEFNQSDWVSVTQTYNDDTKLRKWTIESTGYHIARLDKVMGNGFTVGFFIMPFQITVYETDKPATCLYYSPQRSRLRTTS